ncbi:MAG: RlpA-like double-psi beta-barrel domain-containing protein [Verrucomicrobiales bacterium]|nr:RlpA-like double-psi beta-barrel domain-containing protein [Verrucomicrobiales bacterium]
MMKKSIALVVWMGLWLPVLAEEALIAQRSSYADGQVTASGEAYDSNLYTCGHPSFPFGTLLSLIDAESDTEVKVKVIDRVEPPGGVIILSGAAADRFRIDDGKHLKLLVNKVDPAKAYPQLSAFKFRPAEKAEMPIKAKPEQGPRGDFQVLFGVFPQFEEAVQFKAKLSAQGVDAMAVLRESEFCVISKKSFVSPAEAGDWLETVKTQIDREARVIYSKI